MEQLDMAMVPHAPVQEVISCPGEMMPTWLMTLYEWFPFLMSFTGGFGGI